MMIILMAMLMFMILPYIREFCQLVDEYERGTSGDRCWHWFRQKNNHLVVIIMVVILMMKKGLGMEHKRMSCSQDQVEGLLLNTYEQNTIGRDPSVEGVHKPFGTEHVRYSRMGING